MRMRWPAAMLLAIALSAAGCTAVPTGPIVAVSLPSVSGRWGQVATILRDRLGEAGFTVDVRGAGGDIPTQVTQVDALLATHPETLVLAPVDAGSLTPVLDAADPAVDVISLGTLVRDTPAVDAYVGFDPAVAGYVNATALLSGLGLTDDDGNDIAGGPFRIELIGGSTDDPGAEPAFAAALGVLRPYLKRGALVIGSGEDTFDEATTLRGNPDTAASRLTRILREDYPGAVPDAVLAPSDAIARGVAGALRDAGAVPGDGFPVVTGAGAQLKSLAAMVAGRQYSTLLEDPRDLADLVVQRVLALQASDPSMLPDPTNAPPGSTVDNGAGPVFAALAQPVLVRVDDIDAVVVASGYWSRKRVDEAIAAE